MEQRSTPKNRISTVIIIVLLLTNILQLYFLIQKNNQNKHQGQELNLKNETLQEAKLRIDSLVTRLDVQIEERKKLDKNVEELESLKEQLEKEKKEIQYASYATLKKYKEKIEAYEQLLLKKDKELDKWKGIAEEQQTELTEVKKEKEVLRDNMSKINQDKEKLEVVVAKASILKAENLTVNAIAENGKSRSGGRYKDKHIDKLEVSLNLAENSATKIETKQAFLRIIEPSGSVLVGSEGGQFVNAEGNSIYYTTQIQFLFDNTQQHLAFYFRKGNNYREGLHKVEVYVSGHLIGTGTFTVR